MPSYSNVCDQLDKVTDKISTQVRTVSIGVLAIVWALLSGDSEIAKNASHALKGKLLITAGLAIICMLLDFMQYVSGYLSANSLRKEMEARNLEAATYNYNSAAWKWRGRFFVAKQWVTGFTAVWLLVLLAIFLWRRA